MQYGQNELYINGSFTPGTSTSYTDVVNPATEEVLGQVKKGSVADVQAAIDAAEAAQPGWEAIPAVQRGVYLHKIADGIRAKEQELTDIIVREGGKTRGLANVEVNFTADYLDYMAEWARRYEGEIIQSDRPTENIFLFKKAIGVTTGILPWNFPFFLIARKMAPALITGNTIVVKPSAETPLNAIAFAKIVDEVGLPKGVFNLVTGSGAELGPELSSNSKVGLVSLTGSVTAGQEVMRAAADNITKVSLELGGKAPAIVMADADLDLAATAIVASRVINTGQVCNNAERVFVQRPVYDKFLDILTEKMKAVKYGDPSETEDLDMGPLISNREQENVHAKVKRAVEQGATLHLGGNPIKINGKGAFFEPTILTDVDHSFDVMQEETFGPVLPVTVFDTLDEVIEYANDSDYGLTSSIYTNDLNTAMKAIRGLKFGETYVNRENFEAMQGFHAGWRKSGVGGADGKHGLEEYLATQVVYLEFQ